jgi:hypothetical protein
MTTQNGSADVMDIETSSYKKILLIACIILFAFATYFRFPSNKQTIRHEPVSIETPEPSLIGGFYHFAAMKTPWRSIVIEQMTLANLSGLINASSKVYVTGLGEIAVKGNISEIFANSKFIYEYNYTDPLLHEYPTLKKLEHFCLHNNNSLVWYANSKGSSHPIDDMMAWRGLMNHFVLEKWQMCSELLFSTNYTTCGALLAFDSLRQPGRNTYYAGNMWWAKCSHINRLMRIEKLDLNNRYNAELYVTSEPAVGHFNCYSITYPHFDLNKQNTSCTVNQPLWTIR